MEIVSKEEAVAKAIVARRNLPEGCDINWDSFRADASAAIAAADKWDAEQGNGAKASSANAALEQIASVCSDNMDIACNHRMALDFVRQIASRSNISPGLDSAIQDEIDRPPASIMEEGK